MNTLINIILNFFILNNYISISINFTFCKLPETNLYKQKIFNVINE